MKDYELLKKKLFSVFIGVGIATTFAVALSGFLIYYLNDPSNRGIFGDMFGMINSLFSGLAFAGIIYTILLQRLDLEMQREEIIKSTAELEGQKIALNRQNFENKFFQLINLHHQIVNSIHENWQHGNPPFYNEGREIFGNAARFIHDYHNHKKNTNDKYRNGNKLENLLDLYQTEVYNKHRAVFSHYFRNLYHIVKFIDETQELNSIEKEDPNVRYNYIKILRAQLSSYELVLLAYNGLTSYGSPFHTTIEKYRLLKNIDFDGYIPEVNLIKMSYKHLKDQR